MGFFDFILNPIEMALNVQQQQKNRGLQRETNEQQIELQREAWAREDNAVQRRAQDLSAAGMNPILAAGNAAAAQGPVSLTAPRGEQVHMRPINTLMTMDALRTSRVQRDLIQATADEHRARAESIRAGTSFDVESWSLRLDNLSRNLEVMGERATLLQLEQENLTLRNRMQESDNVIREAHAAVSKELESTRLSDAQQRVVELEIQNELLRMDADRRNTLGIPHSGNIAEKGFIWLMDRAREAAVRIEEKVPSRVRRDIEDYYNRSNRGATF